MIAVTTFVSMLAIATLSAMPVARAGEAELQEARRYYQGGQFLQAARYAFSAMDGAPAVEPRAYALITLSLMRAGMVQSSAYFFVRTLQTGDRGAIRQVLERTETLLLRVGPDLLRKYLIRHTQYSDYDSLDRSAYLYSLGKEALLRGEEQKAIQYLSGISGKSRIYPYALHLRGSAHAILGRGDESVRDYTSCVDRANSYASLTEEEKAEPGSMKEKILRQRRHEAEDLAARCQAGIARVQYQQGDFEEADRSYDEIRKVSLVWPDILFEQAWNAFARQEYNRALGKLVTYKSPALQFLFNSEVEVLRAQSYLMLCLYDDANEVINGFNSRYASLGQEMRSFVERNSNDLPAFYQAGVTALRSPLTGRNDFQRVMNRFVRSPYFQNLASAERALNDELALLRTLPASDRGRGFEGFVEQVIGWRQRSIRWLGGAFVKNSLMDYHHVLLADFDKMSFIKLEMLSRAKDQLLGRENSQGERGRGNRKPRRRDDQYYWSFNGEFWNDEIGDYVFGLESACDKKGGKG